MESEKKKSASDLLTDQLQRYPSLDKLHVQRNLGLGTAAAALVVLIELFSTGVTDLPLRISLFSCAVAIPTWVGFSGLIEYYINLGPKSYSHFRLQYTQALLGLQVLIGGISIVLAISGVLYHLEPNAAYAFGLSIATAIVFWVFFHRHLAVWYSLRDDTERHPGDGT